LAYQMRAERDNEKAQSRSVSLFIAAAKARVWASEGWQVVVTDDTGKTFTPAELEVLCAPDARKSRLAASGEDGQGGDSANAAADNRLQVVKSPEAASAAAAPVDRWAALESAVSKS
jgi:hypothetical protein